MTTTDRDDELELDALLALARGPAHRVPDDLTARILADAEALAPRPALPVRAAPPRRRWSSVLVALGGWPALGALAASVVLGFGLGLSAPSSLSDLAATVRGEPVTVAVGLDDDPLTLLDG